MSAKRNQPAADRTSPAGQPRAVLTIGAHGFTADAFFQALVDAGVDLFCDVRARRGVRGAEYAFANAKRLEARLAELGIRYVHLPEFAPSDAIRQAQYADDAKIGVGKRSRERLSEAFQTGYRAGCLEALDARGLIADQLGDPARPVFFCVERLPEACHRSLLADAIAEATGRPVEHLV